MKKTTVTISGHFGYGVGEAPDAVNQETGVPVKQVAVVFVDESGDSVEVLLVADNATDLAEKIKAQAAATHVQAYSPAALRALENGGPA